MTEYFYPERMGRIILMAMEEVIGREGVRSILDLASLACIHGRKSGCTLREKLSRSKL